MTEIPKRISVDDLPNSPARRKKRASRALPKGEREADHQKAVIDWANNVAALGLRPELDMLFAIPNGGRRGDIEAKKLVGQGVRAGVSDLFFACPAHGLHGLFIEMKAGDGEPSDLQWDWLNRAESRGYAVAVCWTAQQAIDTIEEYLDGRLQNRGELNGKR